MIAKGTGHVAPDFDGRAQFNTLRVKPEYRITLRLGSVEELFPHPPGSPEGRMERMQVLGLFYFPLQHDKAEERFKDAWTWLKEKILGGQSDAEADQALQNGLKARIVGGAAPAAWTVADGPGLPPDAADPAQPAAANFAKIRVPGGYSFLDTTFMESPNADDAYSLKFTAHRLDALEREIWTDNKVLGKIPLVVKVEKREPGSDAWKPAPGVTVHFQLLPAYAHDTPAFSAAVAVSGQFQRPPLDDSDGNNPPAGSGQGPRRAVEAEETRNLNAEDIQGRNCFHDRGGKRGLGNPADGSDVAGVLFETAEVPGFHKDHSGKRKLPHKPYLKAEVATPSDQKHRHAVKTKSNDDGEAGALFLPSGKGGDRYRLRAYLAPPSLTSDGADAAAVAVTTGTLVVWRNIRISRHLVHPASASPDDRLLDQATAVPRYNIANANDYLNGPGLYRQGAFQGLGAVNLNDPDAIGGTFDSIPLQFARAFCETELDTGGSELMDADMLAEARKAGVAAAKKAGKKKKLAYNMDRLFFMDQKFTEADRTVAHLPMRTPEDYNNFGWIKGLFYDKFTFTNGEPDADELAAVGNLLLLSILPAVMAHFTKNGALPGLTIFQGGFGSTWQVLSLIGRPSGIAYPLRGHFLWYGAGSYAPIGSLSYDTTSNAGHELGHELFRVHAPGANPGRSPAEGSDPAQHDHPWSESRCSMAYLKGRGQYCGKCLLAIRGWKL
jgi:hypothetical protein